MGGGHLSGSHKTVENFSNINLLFGNPENLIKSGIAGGNPESWQV
jgi:hypothetical protein